ncbi:dynamin family protein [Pectinatus sottacetonis]|uniref:dynamin family protein n=1 Tax=Pectinatus sottacetonis TaxID=1002795 RepID=UPI0018C74AFF|nr:dynamin family protein [Pectinatus sottacetonis]
MFQNTNTLDCIQSLQGKLSAVYEYFTEHNDNENRKKIIQLADKLSTNEFTIAFCGHFSAGKSKMINCLVDGELLPSSPIPTSANLVKVKSGKDSAKVFFKEGRARLYLAPYDYDLIKKHCTDSKKIDYIEINHNNLKLPGDVVIMDTPGVDSTDDAHRLATRSALHLADIIFYVMDYNHVQSELNFKFTKELIESGKEVYLIVNQIDKHSEQEISFNKFQQETAASFASWGVKPAGIFYTSMKIPEHKYNQFSQLKIFLNTRLKDKSRLLLQSVEKSLEKIIQDHLTSFIGQINSKFKPFTDKLNDLSAEQQESLISKYKELLQQKNNLTKREKTLKNDFDNSITKILDNAYLMPFEIRELAKAYLKSREPGFKVGLFFTKKKTLAEQEQRLNIFYQAAKKKANEQIEWHVRSYLFTYLKNNKIVNKNLTKQIEALTLDFSIDIPMTAVQTGARVSDDYVSTYTDNVAAAIKQTAKKLIVPLKTAILTATDKIILTAQEKTQEKVAGLKQYLSSLEYIQQRDSIISNYKKETAALLTSSYSFTNDKFHLFDKKECDFEIIRSSVKKSPEKILADIKNQPVPIPIMSNTFTSVSQKKINKIDLTAKKLKKIAELIHHLPGFTKTAALLRKKSERLQNKGFTVALFGAFSAGKSSFANALLGAGVLPVSPNPMTAAINNIKPIDRNHPHKSVIIKIKSEELLLKDINNALSSFNLLADSLPDAITKIKTIDNTILQGNVKAKTNYSFLQAFSCGYDIFSHKLNSALTASADDFQDYAAQEEKACFVEYIDIYFDCPLTRQGITLVDTPGADSINARHTGVAFQYIKNSDAVLFITYYNHAFSKADREFLLQLGRVKETFQLDKMFFIINAIDLAENETEESIVIDYVRRQLLSHGIKNPCISPVSSINALREKKTGTNNNCSGMAVFETAFYYFITHDLADMAVSSSEKELVRINRLLEKLIVNTQKDTAEKTAKKLLMEKEKNTLLATIHTQTAENIKNRLSQEMEELLYYVNQRVFLRFNNFFRESFNPSVLRDDGRDLKQAVKAALVELLESLGFDFAQEMRATTIRLDNFIKKIFTDRQTELAAEINKVNPEISFTAFSLKNNKQLDFETAFTYIPYKAFSQSMLYFKNPKSFFEKGGSQLMNNALHGQLKLYAAEYIGQQQNRLNKFYDELITNEFTRFTTTATEQVENFYLSLLTVLTGEISIDELTKIHHKFTDLNI